MYYICRDYLGSITHLADSNGSLTQELSFDAWGRLRDPASQTTFAPDSEPELFLGRGYTGHEHLNWFGLVNMNGRLYDPAVGHFLSPDNYVQLPDFSQNLNRYSYCLNNPLKYNDPDGEFWHIIIGALVGGVVNLVANWDHIDGFWQGLTSFAVGAGAGALVAGTGGAGAGFWATAGVSALGGSVTAGTNSIVSQTGKNFSGFEDINWGQVGISSAIGGAAGFGGGAAGYWAANSSILVNNVSSPLARAAVVSPLAAGAGHIAGGTAAGLFQRQGLGEAFGNSFKGIGSSMALGAALGIATTVGVSYANGINPLTGKPIATKSPGGILSENGVYGTQKGLNSDISDMYLKQMESGNFDLNHKIGGYTSEGKYYIGDGHHRMYAAYRFYQQTSDSFYINHLINTGRWTPSHPSNYGLKIYKID